MSLLLSTFPTSSFLPLLNYETYYILTKDIQAKEHFNISQTSQLTRPAVNNNHRETIAGLYSVIRYKGNQQSKIKS